jgi:hypothetical protein
MRSPKAADDGIALASIFASGTVMVMKTHKQPLGRAFLTLAT